MSDAVERLRDRVNRALDPSSLGPFLPLTIHEQARLLAVVEAAEALTDEDSNIWLLRDDWAFPKEDHDALREKLAALRGGAPVGHEEGEKQ